MRHDESRHPIGLDDGSRLVWSAHIRCGYGIERGHVLRQDAACFQHRLVRRGHRHAIW
jgi:hypothetical protein